MVPNHVPEVFCGACSPLQSLPAEVMTGLFEVQTPLEQVLAIVAPLPSDHRDRLIQALAVYYGFESYDDGK